MAIRRIINLAISKTGISKDLDVYIFEKLHFFFNLPNKYSPNNELLYSSSQQKVLCSVSKVKPVFRDYSVYLSIHVPVIGQCNLA